MMTLDKIKEMYAMAPDREGLLVILTDEFKVKWGECENLLAEFEKNKIEEFHGRTILTIEGHNCFRNCIFSYIKSPYILLNL